jgi:enolase
MAKIKSVYAREILDSRGNPTVQAIIGLDSGEMASACAPSGASTGRLEALELRDGGKRLGGKGVLRAVKNVNTIIAGAIKGMDASKPEEIDAKICEIDGTANKSRLGANASTAVSMAAWKAAAAVKEKPLYAYFGGNTLPVPFLNVINGGKHAGSGLAVQEFMLAPTGFKKFSDALFAGVEVYHALKEIIKKQYGPSGTNVGDEGGFAPMIDQTAHAMQILEDAIGSCGYNKKIFLAADAAASSFYDERAKKYKIDGQELGADELVDFWSDLAADYPLKSLEDPFDEADFYHYAQIRNKIGAKCQIVGDDLTVTNLKLIKKAKGERAINTLLLKVNQIGTVSEAVEAANYCLGHKMGVMVSHRSAETGDFTIADLAVGINCGQIKSGAPCRGERLAKYNRLLEIEDELGKDAKFLGDKAIARY